MGLLSPLPYESDVLASATDPMTGKRRPTGKLSETFINWLQETAGRVSASPERLIRTPLSAQAASIATTSLAVPVATSGLYRVSVFARITQAASVSSSLTYRVGFTDGGVSCLQSGAAMTGNTTATNQSSTFLIRRDQATALTIETVYASVGTPMQYDLVVLVESLS